MDLTNKNVYTVRLADTGRKAEIEYKTIKALANEKYERDIEKIASDIIKDLGLEIRNEKRKNRWKGFI